MDATLRRKLNVLVNGKAYLVEVDDLYSSPITVTVNGQPYVVDIESAEVAPAEAPAAALERVARQPLAPMQPVAPVAPARPSSQEIKAPMPGQIVAVAVKPGDTVSPGQEICMLEAMKMKSAIRSPWAGVIAEVAVTAGQPVAHGELLVIFE